MAEHNTWEREKDLENTKEVVVKFEKKINIEVRWQEKLELAEERDFRSGELSERYIVKMLYRCDNRNFKKKYLKKLERN